MTNSRLTSKSANCGFLGFWTWT